MSRSSTAPPFLLRFLGPRFWPAWLAMGLIRLLCLLPLPVLIAFGTGLGKVFGKLAKSRRHIIETNLRLCFPQMTEAQRAYLTDAHFAALGAGIFETAAASFSPDWIVRRYGVLEGLEHLRAAQADGSGVLLLTGHFTTLEMAARYLCIEGVHFHAMYRPFDNPLVDYWMHNWREQRSGLPALPKDELRGLIKALRQGHRIWYGPDQTIEAPNAMFIPFFGVPTLTLTATSRLASMGRAKVVPYFPQRHGNHYRIVFGPALEDFPSGDDAADARRVNQLLEEAIAHCPEQYFWIHRRFKYRPPGEPDVYAKAPPVPPEAGHG